MLKRRKNSPISVKIELLRKEIAQKYQEIKNLQQICGHDKVIGEYKSNTGNWCPGDDSYWIDAVCEDCGKRWSIDSKEDDHLYRTFKFKKVKGRL